jgi:hypothetical protein
MTDPLSRLLAVDALPRGERLARWSVGDCVPWDNRMLWVRMWYAHHFDELDADAIRRHARPLRLARERLREVRAAYVDCEAQLWAARGDAADLRRGITGTRPQPAPTTDARSRDVLPHAMEMVEHSCESVPVGHTLDALVRLGMSRDAVVAALKARAAAGVAKYGVPLRSFNGRDAREDARQELLDALMYLAQAEMEAQDE